MRITNYWRVIYDYINHPLGRRDRLGTFKRIFQWQIGSRILNASTAMPFVNGIRLLTSTGMHGATGNIYVGLMEFEDMAFVLHFLREGDEFIDVGANVGVYSLLAAASGAKSLALEPITATYEQLLDNLYLNRFLDKIDAKNIGVGSQEGELQFSTQSGPTNHVLARGEIDHTALSIPVDRLDVIAADMNPVMIKMDVEGFEDEVIRGASRLLSQNSLKVVLIEMNGSGIRYGFKDSVIHDKLLSYNFKPAHYDPFSRKLCILDKNNDFGNTLYVRSEVDVENRLKCGLTIKWQNISI